MRVRLLIMTLITTVPFLCALIGLLIYGLAPSHKWLGLVTFGCGLLVAMFVLATHAVKL